MMLGRLFGIALFAAGIGAGGMILLGAARGGYAMGLVPTWIAFGSLCVLGLVVTSLFSRLAGAERAVQWAGAAVVGLGGVAAVLLVLSRSGAVRLADTMQPWALLVVCVLAGGTLLFGSRV
jgi:hypothetical protein